MVNSGRKRTGPPLSVVALKRARLALRPPGGGPLSSWAPSSSSAPRLDWRALRDGALAAGAAYGSRYLPNPFSSKPPSSLGGGIRQGRVMNEGTGGQYSYFSMRPRKCYLPKHVENALPPQVIVSNSASQLKSSVGLQNIISAATIMSPALANQYTTNDKISRVLYQKGTTDITMNNIFLSNCYIIIYDCIARKDCTSTGPSTPVTSWVQGVTDESNPTAYQKLGSTPWQSELFNQYWRVMQTTNIVLGAGATHVHKVRLTPNKIVSGAYSNYTPFALRNLTYYCMIEIHGSPANDTVTQTQVSVGVAGLNIITDAEEHIKQLAKATPTVNIADNSLLTAFTTAEQVVNLGGSTIVPQAEG